MRLCIKSYDKIIWLSLRKTNMTSLKCPLDFPFDIRQTSKSNSRRRWHQDFVIHRLYYRGKSATKRAAERFKVVLCVNAFYPGGLDTRFKKIKYNVVFKIQKENVQQCIHLKHCSLVVLSHWGRTDDNIDDAKDQY